MVCVISIVKPPFPFPLPLSLPPLPLFPFPPSLLPAVEGLDTEDGPTRGRTSVVVHARSRPCRSMSL